MNGVDKLKQWKQSILSSIQFDISLFKYEFKDNLKSFVLGFLRRILVGALVVPVILYFILRVLLIGLGIYLFFWLYVLFMKIGIYILGVLAIGWLLIPKK